MVYYYYWNIYILNHNISLLKYGWLVFLHLVFIENPPIQSDAMLKGKKIIMSSMYKSIEFKLHECLVQLQDVLILTNADSEMLRRIEDCKHIIKTKQYRLAVMGEFKRGKSSLINALLGAKILPADVEPATATINRITFGTKLGAEILFKDQQRKSVPIEELADYVTKLTPDGAARAASIQEAVVHTPSVICQNYVDIIDTPGLNDDADMTKITIDMLSLVDAVIVTIHARVPFSETECGFVAELMRRDNIQNIIFVVTFIDTLDEDDYDYDVFMRRIKTRIQRMVFAELTASITKNDTMETQAHLVKAHAMLDDMHMFGLSAAQALKSFVNNNATLLKSSRFDIFSRELLQIVTAKQVENAITYTIGEIRAVLTQITHHQQQQLAQLRAELAHIETLPQADGAFLDQKIHRLNQCFIQQLPQIQQAIVQMHLMKNTMVGEYIETLASIQTFNHQVLLEALFFKTNEFTNTTTKFYVTMIRPLILDALLQLEKDLIAAIEPSVTAVFLELGMKNPVPLAPHLHELTKRFTENAPYIFFRWTLHPVPQVPDLTQCDIINHVVDAIDKSIQCYTDDIANLIDESKTTANTQFQKYLETVKIQLQTEQRKKLQQLYIKLESSHNHALQFQNMIEKITDTINELENHTV